MSLPVLRACTPLPVVGGPVTPAIVRASIDRDGNRRITAADPEAAPGAQGDGVSVADRVRIADRHEDDEPDHEVRRRSARMRLQWLDSNRESNVDLAEYRAGFGSPPR